MSTILELLGDIDDADVSWILDTSVETSVPAGMAILQEGETPDSLYILLDGLADVRIGEQDEPPLALLGAGELLGEISFLEDSPATATVRAIEDTRLLRLNRRDLVGRLTTDPAFAARLYRAIALTLSRRLQERVGALTHRNIDLSSAPPGGRRIWERLAPEINAFKTQMQQLDHIALKNEGDLPETVVGQAASDFNRLVAHLQTELADASIHEATRAEIGRWVQREILPFILLTRVTERMYSKPRGYAGDFMTIEWIYENVVRDTGRLGSLIDRIILDRPSPTAVRARRVLLAEAIRETTDSIKGRPARILSMAAGPAREIFDVFEALPDRSRLCATCLDIDTQALEHVRHHRDREGLNDRITLLQGNLVYLATGRQKLDLLPQDLIYSIGLIDYFEDRFVVALLDYIHGLLQPGARVILGNYHRKNPDRAFMDHVLEWRLIHRDEADMDRLFAASRFGRTCTRLQLEACGVQMFAECVKGD